MVTKAGLYSLWRGTDGALEWDHKLSCGRDTWFKVCVEGGGMVVFSQTTYCPAVEVYERLFHLNFGFN